MQDEQKIEALLIVVDQVIREWSWYPEESFGSDTAIISSDLLIELQNKYDDLD